MGTEKLAALTPRPRINLILYPPPPAVANLFADTPA